MPKQSHRARELVAVDQITARILLLRGQRVLLDADLAELYQVETKHLIQAVKRNLDRFPEDFMFSLTKQEFNNLRSQIVTSSSWGGRRVPPYGFTEQGVAMLSSVLRSERAIKVNIEIMRVLVKIRKMIESHDELKRKLDAIERKYDKQFRVVFDAIRSLIKDESEKRPIGFIWEEK